MTWACHLARYRLCFQSREPLVLPLFSGSMLRGAFGHALRRICCISRQKQCDGCPLLAGCQYPLLFEPRLLQHTSGQPQPAPPYVLEPPAVQGELAAGEIWPVDVVLHGPALPHLSLIILAWMQAAVQGFGSQRVPAQLCQVQVEQPDTEAHWLTIWRHDQPFILPHATTQTPPPPPPPAADVLRLHFTTPTRLLRQGQLVRVRELQAHDLLAALERRLHTLAPSLGISPPPPLTTQLVTLQPGQLRWMNWQRYSSRQQQEMNLGGFIGDVTLHGELTPLWPWLWLGQWLHVGKNSSFGLGRYQLEAVPR